MENGNSKMQFRMILKIILNWKGKFQASSCKLQAVDNLKKDLTYMGSSYISKITHLLQVQRRTGGN